MQLKLETLPHQTAALAAMMAAFPGLDSPANRLAAANPYANPLIQDRYRDQANIDVQMETGTGKTYVYTRWMYELHQQTGIFKFIVVVPNPSIKEGARSFITSAAARRHFRQFYPTTRLQLNVINAGDFRNAAGRRNFPAALTEFVMGTRQNTHQIQVLLLNAGMLHSKSMTRTDYDQTLLGGATAPQQALAATRPVVIIDEPHRFPRQQKFYADIQNLRPQLICRLGATFPLVTTGRGAQKVTRPDFYRGRPQYYLGAVASFNQGLVKGVDVDYPDLPAPIAQNRYRVTAVQANHLLLTRRGHTYRSSRAKTWRVLITGFRAD